MAKKTIKEIFQRIAGDQPSLSDIAQFRDHQIALLRQVAEFFQDTDIHPNRAGALANSLLDWFQQENAVHVEVFVRKIDEVTIFKTDYVGGFRVSLAYSDNWESPIAQVIVIVEEMTWRKKSS